MVRSLYAAYEGPLYQIVRTTDKQSINISTLVSGGYANAVAQTTFCSGGDTEETLIFPSGPFPWAPGPCCDVFRNSSCPDHCDQKDPGACPKNPGCVGCARCGTPTRTPTLALCMITRIFDQVCVISICPSCSISVALFVIVRQRQPPARGWRTFGP